MQCRGDFFVVVEANVWTTSKGVHQNYILEKHGYVVQITEPYEERRNFSTLIGPWKQRKDGSFTTHFQHTLKRMRRQ